MYTMYHITHDDLDGVGCSILTHVICESICPGTKPVSVCSSISALKGELYDLLSKVEGPREAGTTEFMVTDFAWDLIRPLMPAVVERLSGLAVKPEGRERRAVRFIYVDHHVLDKRAALAVEEEVHALFAGTRVEVTVHVAPNGAATYLLWSAFPTAETAQWGDFARAVDAYDTWKLESRYRKTGEQYDRLLSRFGAEQFEEEFLKGTADSHKKIRDTIKMLDEKHAQDKRLFLKSLPKVMLRSNDRRVAFLWGYPRFTEEVFSAYPELLLIGTYNDGVLHLRSRGGQEQLTANKVAKALGGGGHQHAAGALLHRGSESAMLDVMLNVLG